MVCEEKRYAIREVSELTGIKPVTLRAWQRRYNLIQPERTDKGHRLYTKDHLDKIGEIQNWLAKGISISKVAKLVTQGVTPNDDLITSAPLDEVTPLLDALATLNRNKADSIIASVLKEYPLNVVETQILAPVQSALMQVKKNLVSLQVGLLNTILLHRLDNIIESENKAKKHNHCLVLSYDVTGSVKARLWALTQADEGDHITLVENVEDSTGLLTLENERFNKIAVFSSKSLTAVQLQAFNRMSEEQALEVTLCPLLENLR
jgi:DNA-binding transcriptional MerR regulator